SGAWVCQVPNGSGGFATVTGPAGSAAAPDFGALNTWVGSNLGGAGAIVLGNADTQANAANAVAIGAGAKAQGASGVALGDDVTSGAQGYNVAIGSQGTSASATPTSSPDIGAVAIGRSQTADGDGAVAIGSSNT